jgi:hypothetical protein
MPHREDNPKRPKRRNAAIDGAPKATDQQTPEAFERPVDKRSALEKRAGVADAVRNEFETEDHPVAVAPNFSLESPGPSQSEKGAPSMNRPETLAVCEVDDAPAAAVPKDASATRVVSFANSDGGETDRVVPLTRRRLRRQSVSIEWPSLIDPSRTACGSEERAALLRSIDSLAQGDVRERVLLEALDEEAGELRLVALRSLAQSPPAAGARAFAEILVHGADEERALAIDALLAIEQREALVPAFGDRVDAIAAKAVFAYVGSRRRADYVDLLATRFERPRSEAILALLAGALD